jgi:N-acetyl-anhydromuramyl-L-alanine amidase AmpD
VNWLQWFKALFGASPSGPARTSRNSSSPSKASLTSAPTKESKPPSAGQSTRAKSPKRYPETRTKTPNVSAKPITPKAIVLHHSGGSYAGGVSWIKNPASRVSYHCLVAPDGRRTVFADPEQRTWHAGKSTWRGRGDLNSWSVGAAFAGDTNKEPLTVDAMESMAQYLEPIMRQYNLTLHDITDHRTVSPGRKDDLKASELLRFKSYLSTRLLG